MIESHYPFTLLSLTAIIGVGVFSGAAFAQTAGSNAPTSRSDASPLQITSEAAHQVHKKQVGMTYIEMPIEQITLSRHIGYQDLKLNTPAGAAEVEKRVEATAQEACNQLKALYPLDMVGTDNRRCVSHSVQGAMQQVRHLEANRRNNS
jgi:UrcA family protein